MSDMASRSIGSALACPGGICFADALPKTHSGKIMRYQSRTLVSGTEISGDTSTQEDRSVLDALREEGLFGIFYGFWA